MLSTRYDIVVNFSESHDNYYSAYKFITKADTEVFHSGEHPSLKEKGSPRTKQSTKAYRNKKQKIADKNSDVAAKSTKQLTNFDVSEFLVENQLKYSTQLFAKANEQKQADKTDLASFVLSLSSKGLNDLFENTWAMEGAVEKVARSNVTRIEIIRETIQAECMENYYGVWLGMAEQVFRNNKLHPFVFAETLIIKGRDKHRNVMLIDPANCGKNFLFRPMARLFKVVCNPAEDKCAWGEVVYAEVIFLNDFRWCKEIISWKEMLLLLESQPAHFPALKNHYSKDVCLLSDTPLVATSKSRVVCERNGKSDEVENEMMEAR